MPAPRVLLLIPTTTYRAEAFLAAAGRLGVDVLVASNRCHALAELWPRADTIALHFDEVATSVAAIETAARTHPLAAILAVDDAGTELAATASAALGLPHNRPAAAHTARNKRAMRVALARAGVPAPRHLVLPAASPAAEAAAAAGREIGYPCVVKPLVLAGSRGVIRADDPAELAAAWRRAGAILAAPDLKRSRDPALSELLIESFVPGCEVALEGVIRRGELRTLALFDKPDPLDGPFFEETIYVTPSRLPAAVKAAITTTAARAAAAIGLTEGPVHAELRVNETGPYVIEVAGRSIGGLCSRALRFGLGDVSLEEVILRNALGMEIESVMARLPEASGVMMIPIPRAGVLREVHGVEAAAAVPAVTEVAITIRPGERVTPLPEGSSYLGFIFARARSPEIVEAALRAGASHLDFSIAPTARIAAK